MTKSNGSSALSPSGEQLVIETEEFWNASIRWVGSATRASGVRKQVMRALAEHFPMGALDRDIYIVDGLDIAALNAVEEECSCSGAGALVIDRRDMTFRAHGPWKPFVHPSEYEAYIPCNEGQTIDEVEEILVSLDIPCLRNVRSEWSGGVFVHRSNEANAKAALIFKSPLLLRTSWLCPTPDGDMKLTSLAESLGSRPDARRLLSFLRACAALAREDADVRTTCVKDAVFEFAHEAAIRIWRGMQAFSRLDEYWERAGLDSDDLWGGQA
jgi:hypothetical protein